MGLKTMLWVCGIILPKYNDELQMKTTTEGKSSSPKSSPFSAKEHATSKFTPTLYLRRKNGAQRVETRALKC